MIKKISPYLLLSEIFDNLNTSICSDCPEAQCKTQEECSSLSIWHWRTKEMGCCTFCAGKKGHLEHNDTDPDFNSLQEYFDKEYGFFDNKLKTCRLPREKRSFCCQRYTCKSMRKALKERYGNKIIDYIKDLCGKINEERRTSQCVEIVKK